MIDVDVCFFSSMITFADSATIFADRARPNDQTPSACDDVIHLCCGIKEAGWRDYSGTPLNGHP